MKNEAVNEQRRLLLESAARKVGGRAALGRRLGYKDGAFVGQMISGHRPITEKTIEAVQSLTELRGWFDKTPDRDAVHKALGVTVSNSESKDADTKSVLSEIPIAMPYSSDNLRSAILLLGSLIAALDDRSRKVLGLLLADLTVAPDDAHDVASKAAALASTQRPVTTNRRLNQALTRPDAPETGNSPLFGISGLPR